MNRRWALGGHADLRAEGDFADQEVSQPARRVPVGGQGEGQPDEGVGWAQDAGEGRQKQRQTQPAARASISAGASEGSEETLGLHAERVRRKWGMGWDVLRGWTEALLAVGGVGGFSARPGPVVDGDDGEGGFEAVGQGPGCAEPLPGAAERQCKLQRRGSTSALQEKLDTKRGN